MLDPFAGLFAEFGILNCCEKKIKNLHDPSEERGALLVFAAEVFLNKNNQ